MPNKQVHWNCYEHDQEITHTQSTNQQSGEQVPFLANPHGSTQRDSKSFYQIKN